MKSIVRKQELYKDNKLSFQSRVHTKDICGIVICKNKGKEFKKLILPMEFEANLK